MPQNKASTQVFHLLSLSFLLSLVAGFATFFPLYGSLPLLVVLPLALLVKVEASRFERVKLLTLVLGRLLVLFCFLKWIPGSTLGFLILCLLGINILEATLKDFLSRHYWNGFAGLMVLLSTIFLTIEWSGVYYFTQADGGILFWIFAYTLWNWNFVLLNFSKGISMFHLAVLAAPLLSSISIAMPELWLALRAGSLTFAGVLQIGLKERFEEWFANKNFHLRTEPLKRSPIQFSVLACVSLLCLLFVLMA